MKINDNAAYSFDKNSCPAIEQIEKLYNLKIKNTSDGSVKLKLERALFFDPRKPDIFFGSAKGAQKGEVIAEKLNSLSTEEFLSSNYPYQWLDELGGESLFRILDPSVLTPA